MTLKKGHAGAQVNIIGAKQVSYYGECSSSSGSSANFRLAYSSGTSLITVDAFTVKPGHNYGGYTKVYDAPKMWTYTVIAPSTPLVCEAYGEIYALQ